ncbi:MAG TPA: DUF2784 domain-containing protein [Candidatus Hydrogenedentes bacterium]|nr:DUF2784 domain-containing protein [Candidatus Hydrogenedentota bacterium]
MAYRILDIAFFLFHSAFILFVLTGWIWKRTQILHLAACLLTALSWFGLGFWYGFGYCPCTDWHWKVREHLGYTDMPQSYIKFLIDAPTGLATPAAWVDGITVVLFFLATLLSLWVNFRHMRLFRKKLDSN